MIRHFEVELSANGRLSKVRLDGEDISGDLCGIDIHCDVATGTRVNLHYSVSEVSGHVVEEVDP